MWIDLIWAKLLSRERAEELLESELREGQLTKKKYKEIMNKVHTSLR